MILGIDEVGRGCWAGPLVVGAVVLDSEIDGLTDSKVLSKKRRQILGNQINAEAAGIGLGWVTAKEIDEIGLSLALRLATRRAVKQINTEFHEIIIDGTVNFLSDTPLENYVTTMKKADLLISSVSAASILAKVARDEFMIQQEISYPNHGFGKHVGYGTASHREAIRIHGVTPLHRLSIAPLRQFTLKENQSNRNNDLNTKNPSTRRIGDDSEDVAAAELLRRGHEIIVRNWKTKYCEIDIVSRFKDTFYFTEVKHRKNDKAGDGLAAITNKKLNQMRYAAKFYAHIHKLKNINLALMAISTEAEPPVLGNVVEIT